MEEQSSNSRNNSLANICNLSEIDPTQIFFDENKNLYNLTTENNKTFRISNSPEKYIESCSIAKKESSTMLKKEEYRTKFESKQEFISNFYCKKENNDVESQCEHSRKNFICISLDCKFESYCLNCLVRHVREHVNREEIQILDIETCSLEEIKVKLSEVYQISGNSEKLELSKSEISELHFEIEEIEKQISEFQLLMNNNLNNISPEISLSLQESHSQANSLIITLESLNSTPETLFFNFLRDKVNGTSNEINPDILNLCESVTESILAFKNDFELHIKALTKLKIELEENYSSLVPPEICPLKLENEFRISQQVEYDIKLGPKRPSGFTLEPIFNPFVKQGSLQPHNIAKFSITHSKLMRFTYECIGLSGDIPHIWIVQKEKLDNVNHYSLFQISETDFSISYHLKMTDSNFVNLNFAFTPYYLVVGNSMIDYPLNMVDDVNSSIVIKSEYPLMLSNLAGYPKYINPQYHQIKDSNFIIVTCNHKFSILDFSEKQPKVYYNHNEDIGRINYISTIQDSTNTIVFLGGNKGVFAFDLNAKFIKRLIDNAIHALDTAYLGGRKIRVAIGQTGLLSVYDFELDFTSDLPSNGKIVMQIDRFIGQYFNRIALIAENFLLFKYFKWVFWSNIENQKSGKLELNNDVNFFEKSDRSLFIMNKFGRVCGYFGRELDDFVKKENKAFRQINEFNRANVRQSKARGKSSIKQ